MFPKINRLKRADFPAVARLGKVFHSPLLSLRAFKGKSAPVRVSVVVSKKISKSAVVRNKTRRRIRAVILDFFPQIVLGASLIFYAKTDLRKVSFEILSREVFDLLTKATLLVKNQKPPYY